MTWGVPHRWFAETNSTNDIAREWALAGAAEGAVVTAARQTSGRGRRERKWESPVGKGLYASFILRPDWPATEAPVLAILGGMAAFHALDQAGVSHLRVKWPNDILANGKKICGVLVEPRIDANRIEHAVIGIGINVGQGRDEFPPELQEIATSCRLERATISVDRLLDFLVQSMRLVCHMPLDALRAEWLAAGAIEKEPEI